MAEQKKQNGGCSWILWVLAIIILGNLWFNGSSGGSDDPAPDRDQTQTTFSQQTQTVTVTTREDYPSVPAELQDHFILRQRSVGPCDVLAGDVGLVTVFVDDAVSYWTDSEKDTVLSEIYTDAQTITSTAAGWGVYLNFSLIPLTGSTSYDVTFDTGISAVPSIATSMGLSQRELLNDQLLDIYPMYDQICIAFLFNKSDRAFACPSWTNGEYCVMFRDVSGFFHEVGHLYGAADYYLHPDIDTFSVLYLGESFMNDGGLTIDDLSAYLMGWTDELSSNALGFLTSTSHITDADLSAAYDEGTFTGYGTRETDNGTYTGDLVNGTIEGYGTFSFNDGGSYTGYWHYGSFHGQGTYTWPDGTRYEGEYVNGQRSGWGTLTWITGETYTGEFLNDQFHGQGTYVAADGTVMSGTWSYDQFVG